MTGSTILIILGALLTAIGILGGGFELRELKVPRVGRGARLLAFILGIGLILSQPPLSTLISQWRLSETPLPLTELADPETAAAAPGELSTSEAETAVSEEGEVPAEEPPTPGTEAAVGEEAEAIADEARVSAPEEVSASQETLVALPSQSPSTLAAEPPAPAAAVLAPPPVATPQQVPPAVEYAPTPPAPCVSSHSLARFYATRRPPEDQGRFDPPLPWRANRISISHVNVHKGKEQLWRFRFALGNGTSETIFVGGQEGQRKAKWLQHRAVQQVRGVEWPQPCSRCDDWFLVVLEVICPPPA